jgi:hypothetical protein
MRFLLAALVATIVGCGAIVDSGPSKGLAANDGGTDDVASSPGAVAPGCPDKPPTNGAACVDGAYYCYYYPTADAVCATAWKCTSKGTPPWSFYGGDKNCYETLRADRCNEGLACDGVEPRGGCVVDCIRKCTCDAPTNKLKCTPTKC